MVSGSRNPGNRTNLGSSPSIPDKWHTIDLIERVTVMPIHELQIYFLRLVISPDDPASFEAVMSSIFAANKNDRILLKKARHLFAIPYTHDNGFHLGIVKDRQGNWPHKLFVDGDFGNLEEDGSILAEQIHFMVQPASRLVLVAAHNHSPNAALLKDYLHEYMKTANLPRQRIDLLPILEKEAYEEFIRDGITKKLSFGFEIAPPDSQIVESQIGGDWKKSFSVPIKDSMAGRIDITISAEKGSDNWLNWRFVRDLISKIRPDKNTTKLTALGALVDSNVRSFNLLGPRPLKHTINVASEGMYPDPNEVRRFMAQVLHDVQP
jgi:hypothetical protein